MKSTISTGTRVMDRKRRAGHGKGLGVGERLEEPALLRLEGEDRQERDGDDQQAEEQRRSDLAAGGDDRFRAAIRPACSRSRCLWAFSIITIAASTMAPIAMAMPPRLMMFELRPSSCMAMNGDQHADRQHDDGHQRAAHVQEEDDADQRDDDALLDQRAAQVVDGPLDQLRAVVDRLERDAAGRPAAISAILALTSWMTSSAFSP